MLNVNVVKGPELDIAEIEIVDIYGKTISNIKYEHRNQLQIDLSQYSCGIYFILLKTEKNAYSQKIIVN